jgi:GT2 family glycosyltransferase
MLPPEGAVPVVASTVVHLSVDGRVPEGFAEMLGSLADQDYPALQFVFFVSSEGPANDSRVSDLEAFVADRLPGAVVREVVGNPGFGPTQNEIARMVEGDNGLFLLLHDDVALAPDAVSQLVTEMFRSNAGIVGPKLVDWDDSGLLQHVGLACDRTGEIDPIVMPGERDQEQHDAVSDVFCVPSACLLVRADLFRVVGGFDDEMTFGGEELDLCWRVHLTGGRVMVVPSAVVRHRERFVERNPNVDLDELRERHRIGTVLSYTSGTRVVPVVLLIFFLSLVEAILGIGSGRSRRSLTALGSLVGRLVRFGSLSSRRRRAKAIRVVSDAEIHDLQVSGSARAVSFLRQRRAKSDSKRLETRLAAAERERRARVSIALVAFLTAVFVIGSRSLVTRGVTFVGQFVPFTESWRSLGAAYRLGWWPGGFGSASPSPTGTALVAVATFFSFGNPALVRTAGIVGLLVVGAVGMWRLGAAVASPRARAAGVLAFCAVPLAFENIATGRWGALACWAAAPWVLVSFHSSGDMLTATAADVARRSIRLGLLLAAVAAFEPSFLIVSSVALVVWSATSALASGRRGLRGAPGVHAGAVLVAVVLHVPWVSHYFSDRWWQSLVGADLGTGRGNGLLRVLTFDMGTTTFAPAVVVLYAVVVVAVVVSQGTRFLWAVRGAGLVSMFAFLAVVADQRSIDIALPDPAVFAAFLAAGLAMAAMAAVEAFDIDVVGARFGWRQPLTVLALFAVLVPVFPLAVNAADGRWNQPSSSLDTLLKQLAKNPEEGDYRVLYLGHPDLMPAAPRTLSIPATTSSGDVLRLGYAITDDGIATLFTQWAPGDTSSVDALETALDHLVRGDTPRVGRLLAPLGVRYVVVPRIDNARSRRSAPLPEPVGLLDALRLQLDLRRQYAAADLLIYENVSWAPTVAQQSPAGAAASTTADIEELVLSDLGGATPAKTGFIPGRATQRLTVGGGVVSLAVPPSQRWSLSVDGVRVPSRPAFGSIAAFDVPGTVAGGTTATLRFSRPFLHVVVVVTQFVAWALAVFFALGFRLRRRRPVTVVSTGEAGSLSFGGRP